MTQVILRNEDPSVNRKEPRLREVKQDKELKIRGYTTSKVLCKRY